MIHARIIVKIYYLLYLQDLWICQILLFSKICDPYDCLGQNHSANLFLPLYKTNQCKPN